MKKNNLTSYEKHKLVNLESCLADGFKKCSKWTAYYNEKAKYIHLKFSKFWLQEVILNKKDIALLQQSNIKSIKLFFKRYAV